MARVIRVRISRSGRSEQYLQGDLVPSEGADIEQALSNLQSLARDARSHRSTELQVGIEEVVIPTPEQLAFLARVNAEPGFRLPTQEELASLQALREGTAELKAVKAKPAKKKAAAKTTTEVVNETPAAEKPAKKPRATKKAAKSLPGIE